MNISSHAVGVYPPSECATKRLAITEYSNGKRKVQISSNLLPLFNFPKGAKVVETCLGAGLGYCIQLAESLPLVFSNVKKIYSREYKRRPNNPFETLYETGSQKLLDSAIPRTADHVHIEMTNGKIIVRPVINVIAERIEKLLTSKHPFSVFAACSSGIDAHAAHSVGFDIHSLLEYRPQEARDKTDLTETGALSALGNLEIKHLFNEDITTIDVDMLKRITANASSTLFTISLQCDDFSNAKANKLKEKSVNDLSSTIDMAYDGLRIIEALKFPMVLLEQVGPFGTSQIGNMWDLRLRKMGYKTFEATLDARDHDGLSSRVRYFNFATTLHDTPFSFPAMKPRNKTPIWGSLVEKYLGKMRDVTGNKSMQDGITTGRLRAITRESVHSPCLLRAQRRMAKDSLVCIDGDKILFPTLEMEREIMGLPESFSSDIVSETISSEIIGQGVDYPLYQSIMREIQQHIEEFLFSEQKAVMLA